METILLNELKKEEIILTEDEQKEVEAQGKGDDEPDGKE